MDQAVVIRVSPPPSRINLGGGLRIEASYGGVPAHVYGIRKEGRSRRRIRGYDVRGEVRRSVFLAMARARDGGKEEPGK